VFFILNCLQATLITGTIMMFPASCLDTQHMGMQPIAVYKLCIVSRYKAVYQ